MDHYGRVDIKEIGSKPGEKLDEMLISKHEALLSRCFDKHYYVILPTKCSQELKDKYQQLPAFAYPEFSSRTVLMDRDQIKDMLIKGGFL
jgi:UDP-N-acetylglucosamine 4,6-dehydratase/5-epimerase